MQGLGMDQQGETPRQDDGFYRPTDAPLTPPVAAAPEAMPPAQAPVAEVSWQASEYVHHAKGPGWVIGLAAAAVGLLGLALWLQAWTFAFLIVVMAIGIGMMAFRQPRVRHYALTEQGVQIDNQFYSYDNFKAFGILPEGAFYSALLIPTQRFMPALTVYFAAEQGEQIVDALSAHLPMEQLQPDAIDNLMRKLRF